MALSPWRAAGATSRWRGTQGVGSELSQEEGVCASKVGGQRPAQWGAGSRGQDLGRGL